MELSKLHSKLLEEVMAFNLKGKEEKFFSMLNDHAELCHEAAQLMQDVFEGEVEKREALREIEQKEHEADELVAATMDRLRKTFITPMDREDIQLLIDQLDNTIDNIKEIMDKMVMYQVQSEPTAGAIRMAEIVAKCCKHIKKIYFLYGEFKKELSKSRRSCIRGVASRSRGR